MKQTALYPSVRTLSRCAVCAALSVVFFLSACTNDNVSTENESFSTLTVSGFLSDVADAAITRALPPGYTAFDKPYDSATADDHRIGIFVTLADGDSMKCVFNYTGDNQWTSNVQVRTGLEYYIYGFMPIVTDSSYYYSSITAYPSAFDTCAILTLKNIPAVTAHDICLVTGVAKGEIRDTAQSIEDVGIKPGKFYYEASYTSNYLYLLFDHLYSRVNIKFTVDSAYNALRTIKLNRVEMATTSGSSTFTAVDTLTANTTGSNPMSVPIFTGDSLGTGASATIFTGEDTLSTTETIIPAYVCPSGETTFQLTVQYDVYDKSGNLLTHDRQATNTFTLKSGRTALTTMSAGKSYEIPVTVAPSFLYQMSDADLDNPTIK